MSFRPAFLATLFLAFVCGTAALRAQTEETYILRKLVLADTEVKARTLPANVGGDDILFLQDLPLFEGPAFRAAIQPFVGKPIQGGLVAEIANAISAYARAHDRLITKVLIPDQNVAVGTLRLVVILGTYQELTFQGNRWFSRELLEERLGIKPGDEVRLSTLEAGVNWVNANPFRQIKVMIDEVPNQPGKGTLVVGVQEARPFRAAFTGDNTGNEVIGKQRYSAAFQFGNLWGRDHQGSYQFLTTSKVNAYKGHALDYRLPLPSRHFLQLSSSYVRTNPTFADGVLTQEGKSFMANVRYVIPLKGGEEPRELSFGTSFKSSNNNLDFIGTEEALRVDSDSTDTFQISGSFSTVKRDKKGAWALGVSLYASPGNINSRNTDEAFEGARSGGVSSYIYGSVAIQRSLTLKPGWELSMRGVFQRSSHNLLAGEQLSIGGSGSVRGYSDNVYTAENGFILNNDLMFPLLTKRISFLPKNSFPLESRFLTFFDVGKVEYQRRFGSDINLAALASTGVGFRSSLGNNFSLSFDYGWQLTHLAQQAQQPQRPPLSSRGHLKVVLAF